MTAPTALPYGMRDVKLTKYTDASGTTLDTTSVDLPNMQTFSFSEAEEFQELRGDDRVIAIRGQGALVDWEIDAGGISLAAWEILTGGRVILSGLTPNRKWTLRKLSTDARPYFRAEGQAISDSGGDTHIVVYRCRASDTVAGDMADGEFFITNASGQGLPMLVDGFDLLYDIVQNETATLIPSTPVANPVAPPLELSAAAATGTSPTASSILTVDRSERYRTDDVQHLSAPWGYSIRRRDPRIGEPPDGHVYSDGPVFGYLAVLRHCGNRRHRVRPLEHRDGCCRVVLLNN